MATSNIDQQDPMASAEDSLNNGRSLMGPTMSWWNTWKNCDSAFSNR